MSKQYDSRDIEHLIQQAKDGKMSQQEYKNAVTDMKSKHHRYTTEKKNKSKKIFISVAVVLIVATAIAVPTVMAIRKKNKKYTLVLDYNIESIQDSEIQVKTGSKIADLVPQEIEGYKFDAWYKDENYTEKYSPDDTITGNLKIYGKYDVKYNIIYTGYDSYKPRFELVGAEAVHGKDCVFTLKLAYGYTQSTKFKLYINDVRVIPNKDGVYTISNVQGDLTVLMQDLEPNEYTVSYIVDGSTYYSESYCIYGRTLDQYAPTHYPTKAEDAEWTYSFKGWSLSENGEVVQLNKVKVEGNMTLYAQFRKTAKNQ